MWLISLAPNSIVLASTCVIRSAIQTCEDNLINTIWLLSNWWPHSLSVRIPFMSSRQTTQQDYWKYCNRHFRPTKHVTLSHVNKCKMSALGFAMNRLIVAIYILFKDGLFSLIMSLINPLTHIGKYVYHLLWHVSIPSICMSVTALVINIDWSLYRINLLVFVTKCQCVFCDAGIQF